jgi:methyl-accepting chemotaxis protein
MNAELKAIMNEIQIKMQKTSTIAEQLAKSVEVSYNNAELSQLEEILSKVIYDSDLVIGGGIWFEPFVYDKSEKYVGPYVYKDGEKAVVTYEYSNAEYDYFNYDWYKNVKSGTKNAIFSPLYYDETMDTTMTSCSVPIYDRNGTFIGVVTLDTNITAIQELINHFKVGEEGSAFLLTSDGLFIANDEERNIMKNNIVEDKNQSLAKVGKKILSNEEGVGTYTLDKVKYNVYYNTVNDLLWKIVLKMPQSEINRPVNTLLIILLSISVIAIIAAIIAIITQVRYVTKNINKVTEFAIRLSKGDFTTSLLEIISQDEIGKMAEVLNRMLTQNKIIIKTIAGDSEKVTTVSKDLEKTTNQLSNNFDVIENAMRTINEDMMSSSAAAEEVNASSEEVNASISFLVEETNKSYEMATDIKERANAIEEKSKNSFEEAIQLAGINEANLTKSMEGAKIVDSISAMADSISQIAGQVNLLSLNASIEAARAGEHGKGFAVVASEIGNLAEQTSMTVTQIKQTISQIQDAYNNLIINSQYLLTFVKDKVTPDYQMFVDVAKQYGDDAVNIEKTATKIANMTKNIEKVIAEVGDAIENIADASQNTAQSSGTILSNLDELGGIVETIANAVSDEKEVTDSLETMVNKFKI